MKHSKKKNEKRKKKPKSKIKRNYNGLFIKLVLGAEGERRWVCSEQTFPVLAESLQGSAAQFCWGRLTDLTPHSRL